MKILLLTLLVAILFSLGDSAATKYFHNSPWRWLVLGMVLNSLGVALFGYVASQQGMGVSSGMMLAMNIILNTLLGIYLFKDHLSSMQWGGLGLCILGIVVLTQFS